MLRYIIGISLVAVVLIAIRHVANGRISKKLQYALWLFIPLYMIASNLTAIPVKVPAKNISTVQQTTVYDNNSTIISNPNLVPHPINNGTDSQEKTTTSTAVKVIRSINWPTTLRNIALFVTVLILVTVAAYNLGFVIYCGRKRHFLKKDNATSLNVYRFNHSSSPFLLGKTIYLSDEVADSYMSEYAIWHEYCHYKHGDTYWAIIRYIVFAFNWYNPIIWYAFMLCEQDCELACDEAVLKLIGSNKNIEYGKVLLQLLSNKSLGKQDFFVTTAMNGRSKEFMRRRIVNIKNPAKGSAITVGITFAVALLVTGCAMIKLEEIQPELSHVPNTQIHEQVSTQPAQTIELNTTLPSEELMESNDGWMGGVSEGEAYVDIRDVDNWADGYYTVFLERESLPLFDGSQTCTVYFWDNWRVSQETIDEFTINEIGYILPDDYDFYPGRAHTVWIEEVTFEKTNEFSLLGTDYSGDVCYVDAEHSIYFCKLRDEDSWDMFTGYHLPITCVDNVHAYTLRTSPDCVIYDGTVLLDPQVQESLSTLTPEQIQDVLEFRDTTLTRGAISSISEFREFQGDYPLDRYEYVVIKVEDSLVTEIYFWYLP